MNIDSFRQQLDSLDALLRAEGMPCGADVWQAVYLLLQRLEDQQRLPDDARQLAPLLGPLFCRHPEDQARFPVIFNQWLSGTAAVASVNRMTVPGRAPIAKIRDKVKRVGRVWTAALVLLLSMLLATLYFQPKETLLPQPSVSKDPKSATSTVTPTTNTPAVTIIDRAMPRLEPVPPPNTWEKILDNIEKILSWLPWLLALLYLLKRYHQRRILNSQSPSGDDLLNHFRFERVLTPLFGGAEAEKALRDLRAAHFQPTRRLDIASTVKATAQAGDYFQPVYRKRRSSPEHLLLVRSLHRKDLQAALAEELVERFRKLGVQVQAYRFRDDPRRLVRWNDNNEGDYYALEQLAARNADARLMVISETSILFHPFSGEVRPWLQEFAPWQNRVWLHPRDAGSEQAALLALNNFSLFPLAQDSLPELVAQLTTAEKNSFTPEQQPLPLPELLEAEPDVWLAEKPPYGADLDQLVRQLEHFLGSYGLRLLRAVAVYPQPDWQLMQALDYLLYAKLQAADPVQQRREQRLARLSRLPWMRSAHLPDWLREHLLRGMDKEERQRISTVWQQLFKQLTDKKGGDSLELEIRTPAKRQIKFRLAEIQDIKHSANVNDAIFANILLGGKLGFLDFTFPRAMAKLLPDSRKWVYLRPAVVAMALASVMFFGGRLLWQDYGKQALTQLRQNWLAQQTVDWEIALQYQPNTQMLATRLNKNLLAAKFKSTAQAGKIKTDAKRNIILYAPGGESVAERVAHQLSWMSYGAEVDLNESASLSANSISVQLSQTYQHRASFSDELRHSYLPFKQTTDAKPVLNTLPLEPEMVLIKPGKFLMGSSKKEVGRESDGGPQHKVNITYAFEIGKYEVTFAEYDRFVLATGRASPDDFGWGRENRPVINVSFHDAQAYVRWLAQHTGKKYRLPTEAEWEYVARAGTQTAYWWGDSIGKNNAVCIKCGSEWDVKSTAPVGSFKANPFGLYDTAGNVWEWTLDCWHKNYKNAPEDGLAWLEQDGGVCDRRVVRGGSLDEDPDWLRSAGRNRLYSDKAGGSLGFRVVRAL